MKRIFAAFADSFAFSNKDAAKRISGADDLFGEMEKDVAINPKKFSKVEEISVRDFINNVLPTAKELEVFLENKHEKNMVSLIAPENKEAKSMFKWNNSFSWAYTGNITDSDITQRVINAGGRVDGCLRFSHSWNYPGMRNASLMDLHVFMPGSNQEIVYKNGKEIHDHYGNHNKKMAYICAIIEVRINEMYLRMKNAELSKQKQESIDTKAQDNDTAEYKRQTDESTNSVFEDIW